MSLSVAFAFVFAFVFALRIDFFNSATASSNKSLSKSTRETLSEFSASVILMMTLNFTRHHSLEICHHST